MQFGLTIPNYGPLATRSAIKQIASQGEELGFSIFAIADHIVIPKSWQSPYPYSPTGRVNTFDGGDCLEPLALMAALASVTEKARLVTSVMVVPYRPPVLTAKQVATIDVLSEGRVTLGCGTGWMREEFEAVQAPPFEQRGKVTDEYIAAFRELWTSEEPEFEGEHVRFSDIYFRPQPVQKPHPPIWIGGDSMPALRRTARLGDGWLPVGIAPRRPLNTVSRYRAAVDTLHGLAAEAGREPSDIELAYWAVWYNETARATVDDGTRHIFMGESEETAEDIRALAEIGVTTVLFNFVRDTLPNTLQSAERFAREVMPLARG